MVPHLVSLWLRVSAQTSVEIVFLSKCQLNTSESISIRHCLAAAHRQRLSRIFPGASTSRNNPTVSLPKCHCKLVAATIISHLDYCNSFFAGLPADQLAQLQQIQNNAARLVMKNTHTHKDEITLHLSSKSFTGYL